MAILTPIVIPLAWQLPLNDPTLSELTRQSIFLSSIASILAGATFGDHCSPISDTTIMSSMASGADHIDHVRTQLPYALLVASVSILFGYLPAGFGVSPWYTLGAGFILLILLIRTLGKPV
jgi:Na+/H+ antiporter NhaC